MKTRLEAFENPDEIYEENIILEPVNKSLGNDYSRTVVSNKFGGEYRQ